VIEKLVPQDVDIEGDDPTAEIIHLLGRVVRVDWQTTRKGLRLSPEQIGWIEALLWNAADTYWIAQQEYESKGRPEAAKLATDADLDAYLATAHPDRPELREIARTFHAPYRDHKGRNIGKNRVAPDGPPVALLHEVYYEVAHWWLFVAELGKFSPNPNAGRYGYTEHERNIDYWNPAARLLWLIAKWLDGRYRPENITGLIETIRKSKSSDKAKQARKASHRARYRTLRGAGP
jgi:hypothetical protein